MNYYGKSGVVTTNNYYQILSNITDEEVDDDFGCVGADVGSGIEHTDELRVMKYDEAMDTDDKKDWEKAVDIKHDDLKHIIKATPREEVPEDGTILPHAWAMKKKDSGRYKARLNACGWVQNDGENYDSDNTSAPVANEITLRVVLAIMLIIRVLGKCFDVKGDFLHGEFSNEKPMFIEVPKGWEKFYPKNFVLELLATLYGLKKVRLRSL